MLGFGAWAKGGGGALRTALPRQQVGASRAPPPLLLQRWRGTLARARHSGGTRDHPRCAWPLSPQVSKRVRLCVCKTYVPHAICRSSSAFLGVQEACFTTTGDANHSSVMVWVRVGASDLGRALARGCSFVRASVCVRARARLCVCMCGKRTLLRAGTRAKRPRVISSSLPVHSRCSLVFCSPLFAFARPSCVRLHACRGG